MLLDNKHSRCSAWQVPGEEKPPLDLKEIAGEYYHGNGLGSNNMLVVMPDGRFTFRWIPDVGRQHFERGTAEVREGRLRLHPADPPKSAKYLGSSEPAFLPVRWGSRIYLLADDEADLLDFCNRINLGLEPRETWGGRSYLRLRTSDEVRKDAPDSRLVRAEGLPVLPGHWKSFLLEKPLRGKVVEVVKDRRAAIDLGSDDGLKVGMELHLIGEPDDAHRSIVRVISVEARRTTIEAKDPARFDGCRLNQAVSSRLSDEIIKERSHVFR